MARTNYAGIDYGLGRTNMSESGIRYGVISRNALASWFEDEIEPVYIARCPECGCDDISEIDNPETDDNMRGACGHAFDEDDQFGDEPDYWRYTDNSNEIEISIGETEIFVIKSPVCITAQFCSPCMPGAGNLECPCETGPITYALPLDWFDEYSPCPYEAWDLIDSATKRAYRPNS